MSNLSEEWAMYYAPVRSQTEKLVLVALAQRTSDDGCNGFKSKKTLAQAAMCDVKTVQRALAELRARGVIASGDQSAAAYIDRRYRPHVYDLQIPYSWYSAAQMEHVTMERAARGLPPLTPRQRPDLDAAPPRAARSDKGKAAPQRRPKSLGPRDPEGPGAGSRGDSESPLRGRGDSQSRPGGIESPLRGDSQSPDSFSDSLKRDSGKGADPAAGGPPVRRRRARAAVPAGGQEGRSSTVAAVAVFARLPEDLRRGIGEGASGRVLEVIRRELVSRSVPELAERVERRWAWWLATGQQVGDPVAAAITVLRARRCANLRCEDGQDLDRGGTCAACAGNSSARGSAPAAPAARPARWAGAAVGGGPRSAGAGDEHTGQPGGPGEPPDGARAGGMADGVNGGVNGGGGGDGPGQAARQ
ncbi:helix-turn-helix domain-containing protein, partial [Nonomuraea thailandensis]